MVGGESRSSREGEGREKGFSEAVRPRSSRSRVIFFMSSYSFFERTRIKYRGEEGADREERAKNLSYSASSSNHPSSDLYPACRRSAIDNPLFLSRMFCDIK